MSNIVSKEEINTYLADYNVAWVKGFLYALYIKQMINAKEYTDCLETLFSIYYTGKE